MSTWVTVIAVVFGALAVYILALMVAVKRSIEYFEEQERKEKEEEQDHD